MSESSPLSSTFEEAARVIRDEHARLKVLLHDIRSVTDAGRLLPQLQELRTLLVSHFEHEEMPSSLGSALEEPRFARIVEELFEEHRLFLRALDDVIQQARSWEEGGKNVLRNVAELAQQLHEHEGRENALMLDLADTDLGGRG